MSQKKITIMGATGHIGKVLSESLLAKGHRVQALGRDPEKLSALRARGAQVLSPAFDDAAGLTEAFRGSDGVFLMIPPNYGADDFEAYQVRSGEAIASALQASGVRHSVFLSSIGADKPEGTGPIRNLHRQEKRLGSIPGLNVLVLRPSYFMENLFWSIPVIQGMGLLGTPLRPDLRIPMVATQDIGELAAGSLEALEFQGVSVFEFGGPQDLTMVEVAQKIGRIIGRPDLPYAQFPYEDARKGMEASGMGPKIAGSMIEMNRAFNENRLEPTQPLTGRHRGRTTLDEFLGKYSGLFVKS